MAFEITAYANRTTDHTVTIKTATGGYVQLEATDVVRFKAGRGGAVVLDLDQTATANGSKVTVDQVGNGSSVHASVTVRLAQGDTSALTGIYDAEVLVVDDSETAPANAVKVASYGVLGVVSSLDGDVGLT